MAPRIITDTLGRCVQPALAESTRTVSAEHRATMVVPCGDQWPSILPAKQPHLAGLPAWRKGSVRSRKRQPWACAKGATERPALKRRHLSAYGIALIRIPRDTSYGPGCRRITKSAWGYPLVALNL